MSLKKLVQAEKIAKNLRNYRRTSKTFNQTSQQPPPIVQRWKINSRPWEVISQKLCSDTFLKRRTWTRRGNWKLTMSRMINTYRTQKKHQHKAEGATVSLRAGGAYTTSQHTQHQIPKIPPPPFQSWTVKSKLCTSLYNHLMPKAKVVFLEGFPALSLVIVLRGALLYRTRQTRGNERSLNITSGGVSDSDWLGGAQSSCKNMPHKLSHELICLYI